MKTTMQWCLFSVLFIFIVACGDEKNTNEDFKSVETHLVTQTNTLEQPPSPFLDNPTPSRTLQKYWNLVSFPVTESSDLATFLASDEAFANIDSVWKWDASLGTSGNWRAYPDNGDYSVLTEVLPNEGYWIRASAEFEFAGTGVSTNTYSFIEGWNLIGYSHSAATSISLDTFFSQGDFWKDACTTGEPVESVWAWYNNQWSIYFPGDSTSSHPTLDSFNQSNQTSFGHLSDLEAGMGVWLKSNFSNEASTCPSSSTYTLNLVSISGGTFTMGEPESNYEGKPGTYDALEHQVTLSDFQMSDTEVTNAQYVDFLNAALTAGLIEVKVETANGPDKGNTLVYGTSSAPSEYSGQALTNLSGTRVMKDHDNADNDNNEFTGVIEPENPLNIIYIGFDDTLAAGSKFYVKDPRNASHFDWQELTNYYNYTSTQHELDTSVQLNDYDNWPELADYPNNLPTLDAVKNWPATFIRWYGAKAFALFNNMDLPTEAEWEYAARGGANYTYATSDGNVNGDGTSAIWNTTHPTVSTGHVLDVKLNNANPYGLYNMAGNVWEWIEDWYAIDFYTDATNPVNTTDSGKKVRRGGSWNYHKATLKSAARFSDEKFKGNDHFGFRVVKRS